MRGKGAIAAMLSEVTRDVAAAKSRDPAAAGVGTIEILLTWPGVQALLAHRVAHALFRAGAPVVPRLLAAFARSVTGIEIHPAAQIGRGLFIDHGMGVVIGETARVGEDVTIYQGVTLGGTGFATGKRHPTVEDRVTIGSGAKLLGPITVGHGSKIGANTVVIHDVPANSTVVGIPGHPVRVEGRRPEGPDADWVHLPDPIADAIKGLARRLDALELEGAARTERGGEGAARDPRSGAPESPLGGTDPGSTEPYPGSTEPYTDSTEPYPSSTEPSADTDASARGSTVRGPNPAGG